MSTPWSCQLAWTNSFPPAAARTHAQSPSTASSLATAMVARFTATSRVDDPEGDHAPVVSQANPPCAAPPMGYPESIALATRREVEDEVSASAWSHVVGAVLPSLGDHASSV